MEDNKRNEYFIDVFFKTNYFHLVRALQPVKKYGLTIPVCKMAVAYMVTNHIFMLYEREEIDLSTKQDTAQNLSMIFSDTIFEMAGIQTMKESDHVIYSYLGSPESYQDNMDTLTEICKKPRYGTKFLEDIISAIDKMPVPEKKFEDVLEPMTLRASSKVFIDIVKLGSYMTTMMPHYKNNVSRESLLKFTLMDIITIGAKQLFPQLDARIIMTLPQYMFFMEEILTLAGIKADQEKEYKEGQIIIGIQLEKLAEPDEVKENADMTAMTDFATIYSGKLEESYKDKGSPFKFN